MNLVLLGPPGSGKGTQAGSLTARFGFPHISTGEIIRETISQRTPLAERLRSYADGGRLVPDELVNQMVDDRLAMDDCAGGFLLDGYPRTIAQAKALDASLQGRGQRLDRVLLLEVPDELLMERITGRRSDPETGRPYHVLYDPPPPEIEYRLVQRADDTEQVLACRLEEYHDKTAPLIPYYEASGVLSRVDGTGSIDQIRDGLLAALGREL